MSRVGYVTYSLVDLPIAVGDGAIEDLSAQLRRLGIKKPLIVTDTDIVEKQLDAPLKAYLTESDYGYAEYSQVRHDPYDYMVAEAVEAYKENACDGIIGFGGGSSMDVAKCAAVMVAHEGEILDYSNHAKAIGDPKAKSFARKGCPCISIPTTSGTGSEVSRSAVITKLADHRKTTVAHDLLLSDAAILDTHFVLSLPKDQTASAGIDALCHAIEAYTHRTTIENPCLVSDAVALEAIRLIGRNLVKAFDGPDDDEARLGMQWAALLAGIALNIGAGECHAIGSMLAKYNGAIHGVSVGIPLPYVMKFNAKFCPQRFADIAEALGEDIAGLTVEEAAECAAATVSRLLARLDFPMMKDYVKDKGEIEGWAEECAGNSCCTSNKRMDSKGAILEVCTKCWMGEL